MQPFATFLRAYLQARRLDALRQRAEVERITVRALADLQRFVTRNSPFYGSYAKKPFKEWPLMTKATWMEEFDRINTVGAQLQDLLPIAHEAEVSRNFAPTWRDHTVGLSTGTSGHRGLFLVSPRERSQWAATLIAKMLPGGLLSRERIALVFRAGSPLYESVAALGVRFRFFDQARPWEGLVRDVCRFQPTILVAQPRVLRLLAQAPESLTPRRIVSVAEVLDQLDKTQLEARFGVPVEQIYQATEGLLGVTCGFGTIHLNEPYLIIEPQWQDTVRSRFIPVITDLFRRTQPVIRYRLNDVLRLRSTPCPCGRAALAVEAIEGRFDDLLWLRNSDGEPVPVFADLLTRVLIRSVPLLHDYEIVEVDPRRWRVGLQPLPSKEVQQQLVTELVSLSRSLGAEPPALQIDGLVAARNLGKQRRVRGLTVATCES